MTKYQIHYADQLTLYLDKPVRVYFHGGELLAVGVFHGGMQRGNDFVLFFGTANWQLIVPGGNFHLHDVYIEEVLPILPCLRCKRLHTLEQTCNLPGDPSHSQLCPDGITDFPHHHI